MVHLHCFSLPYYHLHDLLSRYIILYSLIIYTYISCRFPYMAIYTCIASLCLTWLSSSSGISQVICGNPVRALRTRCRTHPHTSTMNTPAGDDFLSTLRSPQAFSPSHSLITLSPQLPVTDQYQIIHSQANNCGCAHFTDANGDPTSLSSAHNCKHTSQTVSQSVFTITNHCQSSTITMFTNLI